MEAADSLVEALEPERGRKRASGGAAAPLVAVVRRVCNR